MMKRLLGISVLIILWMLSGQATFSQDSDEVKSKTIRKEVKVTIDKENSEPKYTVETTTTENGEKKVVKKTYNSFEEMKADKFVDSSGNRGEVADRDRRGIRGENRLRFANLVEFVPYFFLNVDIFGDRLDYDIAVG